MNIAPLQLKTYFITEIHVTTRHTYDPKQGYKYRVPNLKTDVKYLVNKEYPGVWQVPLNIKYTPQKGENVPYGFTVNIIGFFEVDKSWPKNQVESIVRFNAPAMLYSATRELIATISGRGPWGSILLPSVNFLPKTKKIQKRRAKSMRVKKAK